MKRYRLCAAMVLMLFAAGLYAQQAVDAGKQAYEKGDYHKAISVLKSAAEKEPNNGDVHLWLAKSYLEAKEYDEAVKSGEKAVAIDPKNSMYHLVLGEAYGQKADHASKLSAFGLARKTQKEFETAVQLDEHNYKAAEDLVDYDCTAPGMVGGGADKAQPIIQKLMTLDAAEGHYAAGVCKADKKDFAGAEAEYSKALESKPKSADVLFEMGEYFMEHGNGDKVLAVAAQAKATAPNDPRTKFYQAVGWALKNENQAEAAKLLNEYVQEAPVRSNYPSPAYAHYWLGRVYESQKNADKAKNEYQEALKLDPKLKKAEEALKQIGGK
jgi:tetratricopeptide (TPR) repeat protein